MALAALEKQKRTPSQTISDPGYFNFGNHTFRDDKKGGHGIVDMQKSIVESCDTYYYLLARDMGVNMMHDFMKPLGFGQITGIDLQGNLSSKNGTKVKRFLWVLAKAITPSLFCN
jgi:penicillin-binding protein 2